MALNGSRGCNCIAFAAFLCIWIDFASCFLPTSRSKAVPVPEMLTSMVGTQRYVAPEVLKGSYDFRVVPRQAYEFIRIEDD